MSPLVKNILAVVIGWAIGAAINMGLIMLGGELVPLPAGIDPMNPESLKAGMHLFETKHYLFPFLAHALGTLVGAFTAAKIAATHKHNIALGIGCFFLLGGIMMVFQVPSPTWFTILDLGLAYIPMALLGWKLAK